MTMQIYRRIDLDILFRTDCTLGLRTGFKKDDIITIPIVVSESAPAYRQKCLKLNRELAFWLEFRVV